MELFATERLIVRRFVPEDGGDLFEYLSDEEVVKYEPYDVYTRGRARREANRRAKDESFYAVCLKSAGKLIGNLYLGRGDFDTWELGYVFNRNYQGQGYATESAKALIDYAFTRLGARRITAYCNKNNESSWKLLERLGLRREGLFLRNLYFKKDKSGEPIWIDSCAYAMLKEEWLKRRET